MALLLLTRAAVICSHDALLPFFLLTLYAGPAHGLALLPAVLNEGLFDHRVVVDIRWLIRGR